MYVRRSTIARAVTWGVLAAALGGALAGCTVGSSVALKPQSHFSYPNSNVTPIGRVRGEATTQSIFAPNFMDADVELEAIQAALKEKGGDVLIDYVLSTKTTMIPLFILNVFVTTYTVEGTAAKMVIGKRELR